MSPDAVIETISGHYTVEKEIRLKYKGNDVLCVIGMAVADRSCCGYSGCRYAMVPGSVLRWKYKNNPDQQISEVEPIVNADLQKKISEILKKEEVVTQINFW